MGPKLDERYAHHYVSSTSPLALLPSSLSLVLLSVPTCCCFAGGRLASAPTLLSGGSSSMYALLLLDVRPAAA